MILYYFEILLSRKFIYIITLLILFSTTNNAQFHSIRNDSLFLESNIKYQQFQSHSNISNSLYSNKSPENGDFGIGFSGHGNYSIIDESKMDQKGVGDSFGFGFGLRIFYSLFMVGTEFSWEFASDNKPFTNNIMGGGSASSSINFLNGSSYLGLKSPSIYLEKDRKYIIIDFNYGYMSVGNAKRQIIGCSNCDEQTLDISGGNFLMPEIIYQSESLFGGGMGFGVSYKYFYKSDYKGVVLIRFIGIMHN